MTSVAIRAQAGRLLPIAATGLVIVLGIALMAPRVGPIGSGTMIALFVAVIATRQALRGHRDDRL